MPSNIFSEVKYIISFDLIYLILINCVPTAQDLARERLMNFGDEIASQIRLAKKRRWAVIEEKRIREEIELQTYLNDLIEQDKKRKLETLEKENLDEEEFTRNFQSIISTCDKHAADLNAMFSTLDIRRKVRILYLCTFNFLD